MMLAKRALFLLIFAAIAFAAPVSAAEPDDQGIPAYSIARLKVLAGSVWTRTAEEADWAEAQSNTPLTPHTRVSVPEGSEAELQFHGGQFVLLTAGTELEVREMAADKTTFRLRAGEIRFDLPGDDFALVNVRVPGGGRAEFPVPGRYWLTVTDDDTTRLIVRRGEASVSQEGAKYRLNQGDEATIGRVITVARYEGAADAEPMPEPLSETERSAGVPPVVGYELREYGEWVNTPAYGYVWRPRVAAGWSPYTYGRWVWISPYGWTWVSYEPWGWYPYHSGYWYTDPVFGWVWSPFQSFVSVGFVFGIHDHFHHNHFFPHRDFRFQSHNARFVSDGRDFRWVPARPGERVRGANIPRGDARLAGFNRPLDSGRVFSRSGPSSRGGSQSEWRDVTVVRSERQAAIRTDSSGRGGEGRDVRQVRPELRGSAPQGSRGQGGSQRQQQQMTAPRGGAPGSRSGSEVRDAAPRPQGSGSGSGSRGGGQTGVERAPVRQAPDRSIGGGSGGGEIRGGGEFRGGDRGGGSRGGSEFRGGDRGGGGRGSDFRGSGGMRSVGFGGGEMRSGGGGGSRGGGGGSRGGGMRGGGGGRGGGGDGGRGGR